MKLFFRAILSTILIIILLVFSVGYFIAGDRIISYLGKSLKADISFENHCTLFDAFVSKKAILKDVTIEFKDAPIILVAKEGIIAFDYSKVFKERKIGLLLAIDKPEIVIKNDKESEKAVNALGFLPSGMITEGMMSENRLSSIYCHLFMGGNTADFKRLTFNSDNIILNAEGAVSSSGKIDLKLKMYFSSIITAQMPANVVDLLEDRKDWWKSYTADIFNDPGKSSFKVTSPRFKLEIGNTE